MGARAIVPSDPVLRWICYVFEGYSPFVTKKQYKKYSSTNTTLLQSQEKIIIE